MTFHWLPSHSYFKFWLEWCQLSIHQTTLTVTTLTFISVSSQTSNGFPTNYITVTTLFISVSSQTSNGCPPKYITVTTLTFISVSSQTSNGCPPNYITVTALTFISVLSQTSNGCPPNYSTVATLTIVHFNSRSDWCQLSSKQLPLWGCCSLHSYNNALWWGGGLSRQVWWGRILP